MSLWPGHINSRESLQIKRHIEERIRSAMRETALVCSGTTYRFPKNRSNMIETPMEPLPSPSGPDPMLEPWWNDDPPTPTPSPSPQPTKEN